MTTWSASWKGGGKKKKNPTKQRTTRKERKQNKQNHTPSTALRGTNGSGGPRPAATGPAGHKARPHAAPRGSERCGTDRERFFVRRGHRAAPRPPRVFSHPPHSPFRARGGRLPAAATPPPGELEAGANEALLLGECRVAARPLLGARPGDARSRTESPPRPGPHHAPGERRTGGGPALSFRPRGREPERSQPSPLRPRPPATPPEPTPPSRRGPASPPAPLPAKRLPARAGRRGGENRTAGGGRAAPLTCRSARWEAAAPPAAAPEPPGPHTKPRRHSRRDAVAPPPAAPPNHRPQFPPGTASRPLSAPITASPGLPVRPLAPRASHRPAPLVHA